MEVQREHNVNRQRKNREEQREKKLIIQLMHFEW